MLCECCKIREANIQYTEVINGVKAEHNLCAQCARELDFGPYSAIFDSEMPLGRLLSGLLGLEESAQKKDKIKEVTCPNCKLSYEEFVNNSCFGCQDCYGVFDLLISDNIKQLQGSDAHSGKRPQNFAGTRPARIELKNGTDTADDSAASVEEQIQILDARLKDALRREEYEQAAIYRDKIRALRKVTDSNQEDEKGGGGHAEMV